MSRGKNRSLPARIPSLALGWTQTNPQSPLLRGHLVGPSQRRPTTKTCQRPILLPAPVGVVCAFGRSKRCGLRHGAPFWHNLIAKDSLMGPKPLLTAALPRPKKGTLCRSHQEGQRYEVDGGGRRPRCSSGKPPGIGVRSASDLDRAGLDTGVGAAVGLAKSPRASLMTRRRTQTPFASVFGLGALI